MIRKMKKAIQKTKELLESTHFAASHPRSHSPQYYPHR